MTSSLPAPDWHSLPYQTVQRAAMILGCSTSNVYRRVKLRELELHRLGGRSLVTTASLISFLDSADKSGPARDVSPAVRARIAQRQIAVSVL